MKRSPTRIRIQFLTVLLLCSLFTACEPNKGEDIWGGNIKTGTGGIFGLMQQFQDFVKYGKNMGQSFKGGVEEVQNRAEKVQLGIRKIQEGKLLLQEGLGTIPEEVQNSSAEGQIEN